MKAKILYICDGCESEHDRFTKIYQCENCYKEICASCCHHIGNTKICTGCKATGEF